MRAYYSPNLWPLFNCGFRISEIYNIYLFNIITLDSKNMAHRSFPPLSSPFPLREERVKGGDGPSFLNHTVSMRLFLNKRIWFVFYFALFRLLYDKLIFEINSTFKFTSDRIWIWPRARNLSFQNNNSTPGIVRNQNSRLPLEIN